MTDVKYPIPLSPTSPENKYHDTNRRLTNSETKKFKKSCIELDRKRKEKYPGMSSDIMKHMIRGDLTNAFKIAMFNEEKSLNYVMNYARETGKLGKPWVNVPEITEYAKLYGYEDIVELFSDYSDDDGDRFEYALYAAVDFNDIDKVNEALLYTKTNLRILERALELAAEVANYEIVDMIYTRKGEGSVESILIGASKSGRLELIERYSDRRFLSCNYAACLAARNGHLEVIKYLETFNIIDFSQIFSETDVYTRMKTNVETVEYCIEKLFMGDFDKYQKSNFFRDIILNSAKAGDYKVLEYAAEQEEKNIHKYGTENVIKDFKTHRYSKDRVMIECLIRGGVSFEQIRKRYDISWQSDILKLILETYRYQDVGYAKDTFYTKDIHYSGDLELLQINGIEFDVTEIHVEYIEDYFYDMCHITENIDDLANTIAELSSEPFARVFNLREDLLEPDNLDLTLFHEYCNYDYISYVKPEVITNENIATYICDIEECTKNIDFRILDLLLNIYGKKYVPDDLSRIKDYNLLEAIILVSDVPPPNSLLAYYSQMNMEPHEIIKKKLQDQRQLMTKTALGRTMVNPMFDKNLLKHIKTFTYGDFSKELKERTDITKNLCSMIGVDSERFKRVMKGILDSDKSYYIDLYQLNICAGSVEFDIKFLEDNELYMSDYYLKGLIKGLRPIPEDADDMTLGCHGDAFSDIENVQYLVDLYERKVIDILAVLCLENVDVMNAVLEEVKHFHKENGLIRLTNDNNYNPYVSIFLETRNINKFSYFISRTYEGSLCTDTTEQSVVLNQSYLPKIASFDIARYMYIIHGRIYDRGFEFLEDVPQIPQDEVAFQKFILEDLKNELDSIPNIEDKRIRCRQLFMNYVNSQPVVDYFSEINPIAYSGHAEPQRNFDEKQTSQIIGKFQRKNPDYKVNFIPQINELLKRYISDKEELKKYVEDREKMFGYFITKITRGPDDVKNLAYDIIVQGTNNMINYMLRVTDVDYEQCFNGIVGSTNFTGFLFFYYLCFIEGVEINIPEDVIDKRMIRFLESEDFERNMTFSDYQNYFENFNIIYDNIMDLPKEERMEIAANEMENVSPDDAQTKFFLKMISR